jgi:hypothetical protein
MYPNCLQFDNSVAQTYFSRLINSGEVEGIDSLYNGLDESKLQLLIEDKDTYLERRNKFLDHLMARFAETFNDYAPDALFIFRG